MHSVMRPTDINDPVTGEPLYVLCKVRPRWYWHMRRLSLFLGIVWRHYEDSRIDWATAWDIARGVYETELAATPSPHGEG